MRQQPTATLGRFLKADPGESLTHGRALVGAALLAGLVAAPAALPPAILDSMGGQVAHVDAADTPPPWTGEKEMRWLAEHWQEYVGKWVVLDGDRLVLATADPAELVAAPREVSGRAPFVTFVDDEEIARSGGW